MSISICVHRLMYEYIYIYIYIHKNHEWPGSYNSNDVSYLYDSCGLIVSRRRMLVAVGFVFANHYLVYVSVAVNISVA